MSEKRAEKGGNLTNLESIFYVISRHEKKERFFNSHLGMQTQL